MAVGCGGWLCGFIDGFSVVVWLCVWLCVWFVSGILRLCVVGWLGCVVRGMVRCVDVSVLFVSF